MDDVITVFIADDHRDFREDVKGLIAKNNRLLLLGEASDGDSALDGIVGSKPQIALLDINMPGTGGLEVAERVAQSKPEVGVIIVTAYKEESLFNRAMDLGVKGYVLKDDYVTDLPQALVSIIRGEHYFSPALASFYQRRNERLEKTESSGAGLDDLTPSELRVLRLLSDALSSEEIARRLGTNLTTVIAHLDQIRLKHKLKDSRGLVALAQEYRSELKDFKLFPEDFE